MSWTWSSVECDEVHGTRSENYSVEAITCEVTLKVSAANKNALVIDLILNGMWPDPDMDFPPKVRSCVATPVVVNSSTPAGNQSFIFSEYNVKVSYSTDESEDLVSETLEPDAEFMRLDHTFFRWKADGAPLTPGEAPGLLVPKMKLTREFFNRIAVPSELLLAGHVHNANYTSPTFGLTFAANTLMLMPQPVSVTRTTAGSGKFNYGASFLYNSFTWNKFLRLDAGTYDSIILPNGSDAISYPMSNLITLLL